MEPSHHNLRRFGHNGWAGWGGVESTQKLYIEPIYAYRMWLDNGNGLESLNYRHHWEPGINQAACLRSCIVPNPRHTCGFYGLKSFNRVIDIKRDMTYRPEPGAPSLPLALWDNALSIVLGCARFSGMVIIGEWGYRSEKAQIHQLSSIGVDPERLDELCEQYEASVLEVPAT